ncbi:hypothetical protein [Desulfobacterium sp. N47]|uniref:Uncharacterized protein n=1 Tax=uncultured Desulfobacterium sp. TaxID=201089 RepID=E1YEL4_9BACT|nr:hypothetical protein N47_P17130 [uncultured Desulfobacterium sp.]
MSHTGGMLSRLPLLYREGDLVGRILALCGLQIEILDELMLGIQQSHWFDSTKEVSEAEKLASVLGIERESWQDLGEYRAWVHALRNGWLKNGTTTVYGLKTFIEEYINLYQDAVDTVFVPPIRGWREEDKTESEDSARFIENPKIKKYKYIPENGGIEPLHQFTINQRGIDDTSLHLLYTGITSTPEYVPVCANITTGQALIYLGEIPPGKRLWITAGPSGIAGASLEGEDVTKKLRSITGYQPGMPWSDEQFDEKTLAIKLVRGENRLWFLPVAHYDRTGLDRFLLAFADTIMHQGRLDETSFDQSLFYQQPVIKLTAAWYEAVPASFAVSLSGGIMRFRKAGEDVAETRRRRLIFSLQNGVNSLKAAGIKAAVSLAPFTEVQHQRDTLRDVSPKTFSSYGPTGRDAPPKTGAIFGKSKFEEVKFS